MFNRTRAAAAHPLSFIAFAGAALIGTALTCTPALAAYEVVAVTNGGTIDGVVSLSGAVPTEAPIKVTKNQDYCGQTIPDRAYTVDAGGGLANVIAETAGAHLVLTKPFESDDLIQAIEKVLGVGHA
jgi:hypothetical protein